MNRIGYLPKDTKLFIDGTQNGFSRIYLAKDKYGWAMTKDLKQIPLETLKPTDQSEDNKIKEDNQENTSYTYTPNKLSLQNKQKKVMRKVL